MSGQNRASADISLRTFAGRRLSDNAAQTACQDFLRTGTAQEVCMVKGARWNTRMQGLADSTGRCAQRRNYLCFSAANV